MKNSCEIARSQPPLSSSRTALRWSIPLLIPALCLFLLWDLYIPLTAERATRQLHALIKSGMEVNAAAKILNANGFDTEVYDHEFIWVGRRGHKSLIAGLADNIERIPLLKLHMALIRIELWDYESRNLYIKVPAHGGNRIDLPSGDGFHEKP